MCSVESRTLLVVPCRDRHMNAPALQVWMGAALAVVWRLMPIKGDQAPAAPSA